MQSDSELMTRISAWIILTGIKRMKTDHGLDMAGLGWTALLMIFEKFQLYFSSELRNNRGLKMKKEKF